MPTELPQRFWDKVDKASSAKGCWLWTAYCDPKGYGFYGKKNKDYLAHRVAYEHHVGAIPAKMFVDHKCHTPNCVNPEHLRLATNKQNMENLAGAHKDSRSGIRGVCWNARKDRWMGRVHHHGKAYFVGYFTDLAEADEATRAKRNELFTHNDADRK